MFDNISAKQSLIEDNILTRITDIDNKYDEIMRVKDIDMPECQKKVKHNERTVFNFLHYVIKRFNQKIMR